MVGNDQVLQLTFRKDEKPWNLTLTFTNNTQCAGNKMAEAYKVQLNFYYNKKNFPDISEDLLGD